MLHFDPRRGTARYVPAALVEDVALQAAVVPALRCLLCLQLLFSSEEDLQMITIGYLIMPNIISICCVPERNKYVPYVLQRLCRSDLSLWEAWNAAEPEATSQLGNRVFFQRTFFGGVSFFNSPGPADQQEVRKHETLLTLF